MPYDGQAQLTETSQPGIPGAGLRVRAAADPGTVLRREARRTSASARDRMRELLSHATAGAFELHAGNRWAESLTQFEDLAMAQLRAIANFPIGSRDPAIGPLVRRVHANFVAFREAVRQEIMATIDATTEPVTVDVVLTHVESWATLVTVSLDRLETALSER